MEKYNIIYADPPWKYERQKGEGVAADRYQTMAIQDIRSIPVDKIAADDAVLFLWVTFPKLREGLSVIDSWGFQYKTCAFNWIKQNPKSDSFFVGLGFWTRSCSEICLLATKGHPHRASPNVSTAKSRMRSETGSWSFAEIFLESSCLPERDMKDGNVLEMRSTAGISGRQSTHCCVVISSRTGGTDKKAAHVTAEKEMLWL